MDDSLPTPGTITVCVYAASHEGAAPWGEAAWRIGRTIAEHGWGLVYGGGTAGLMGKVAAGALSRGGRVAGATLERLLPREGRSASGSATVYVGSMHERKQWMESHADAFVVLPGGVGTLEEFLEIISLKQLAFHSRPVVLFNPDDYWGPLVEQLARAVERFGYQDVHGLFQVAATVEDCEAALVGALGDVPLERKP